jgi:glycerol-3-phosphate dehydrogenase
MGKVNPAFRLTGEDMQQRKDALDLRDRRASFQALRDEPFDVLVIGAGITGCGVARDAAMRGLRVALVDARDIGAGTSSRSSKLIHGGLRYLAQGDVFVVREAAVERRTLRTIAPHLAQTMPVVFPVGGKLELAKVRTGMWTYEKLGNVDPHERHEIWEPDQLEEREPCMVPGKISAAVVYPEYLTDDFRLTLGNARSALAHGARVVTYGSAVRMIEEEGRVVGAVVRGTLPGESEESEVFARVVVNAAGPWVDAVRRLEDRKAKKKVQFTKGIHLVVPRARLPIRHTIIMATSNQRSIFAIPREGVIYIGTTDTHYPDAKYWPEIDREDVDYLLGPVNQTFRVEPITDQDILAAWSGIRPLLRAEGKKPSEISRRHEIMDGPGGVLTVAGGKLTSYRSMAERVVDRCEERLDRRPQPPATAEEPLPGGDFSGTFEELGSRVEALGLAPEEAERATRLYGNEAFDMFSEDTGLAAEVRQAVLREGALTLEDYWFRRSARARFNTEGGLPDLEKAAACMGEMLGWTQDEKRRNLEDCRSKQALEMSFRLEVDQAAHS